jgi:hypothetical protein
MAWWSSGDSLSEQTIEGIFIEVEAPEITAGRPAVTEQAAPAVPDGHLRDTADGPTMGKAHVEASGFVRIEPEPVSGKAYLVWGNPNAGSTYLMLRQGERFTPLGYYTRSGGGEPVFTASAHALPSAETHWVLARLDTPVNTFSPEALEQHHTLLQTQLRSATTQWETLGEALVEMAKDKDWCSNYEDFARPLGLPERETRGDWVAVVSARIEVEIDSPDSSVDSRLSSIYDLPELSTTSLSFTGTVEVRVYRTDCTEDDFRDGICTDDIVEALDSSADINVIDWEIERVDVD